MSTNASSEDHHRRHGQRNYFLFVFEGGAFISAIGFINPNTLLPSLILEAGGPVWLAAFAPCLMIIGMFSFPILSYAWVERLERHKGYTLTFSFFQRIVYFIAALLLFFYGNIPLLAIGVLALAPFLSGAIGGLCLTSWQQLFMGAVPPQRRASNLAIRFLIGGLMGVVAGLVIKATLDAYPGHTGWSILHAIAFGFMTLSFIGLTLVKENPHFMPPREHRGPDRSKGVFSEVLAMALDPHHRKLWVVLFLMHSIFLIAPFYAVAIRERFDAPTSFLGELAIWQMIGSSLGNLAAGIIGDRMGGRKTFLFGILLLGLILLPAPLATNLLVAKILYLGFGFFMMMTIVGKDTIIMEMAPDAKRSLFLSASAFASMIGMLASSLASYLIWQATGSLLALILPSSLIFLTTSLLLFTMRPHKEGELSPFAVIQRGILRYFR
jgi:MFS family permease